MGDQRLDVVRVGSLDLPLPARADAGAAGYDLRVDLRGLDVDVLYLVPGLETDIPTGFAFRLPRGWCGLVLPRCRSGGLDIENTLGVIDSNDCDELVLSVRATRPLAYCHGERIAQLVIIPHASWEALLIEEPAAIARGQRRRGRGRA